MTHFPNTPPLALSGGTPATGPERHERQDRRDGPDRQSVLNAMSGESRKSARAGVHLFSAREMASDALALICLIFLWAAAIWALPILSEVLS